jgi:hypothetical protein
VFTRIMSAMVIPLNTSRAGYLSDCSMNYYTNSKSKRYFCWHRRRLPQRMYNTPRRLLLAAAISSLI